MLYVFSLMTIPKLYKLKQQILLAEINSCAN